MSHSRLTTLYFVKTTLAVLVLAILTVGVTQGAPGKTEAAAAVATEAKGEKPAAKKQEPLPAMDSLVVFDEPAELVHREPAKYPALAQRAGLEGKAVVKVLVDKDGSARETVVFASSGSRLLDRAAQRAAGLYRYRAAQYKKQPIAVWVTHSIDFILNN